MRNCWWPQFDSRRLYGASSPFYGRFPRSALRFSWAIFVRPYGTKSRVSSGEDARAGRAGEANRKDGKFLE